MQYFVQEVYSDGSVYAEHAMSDEEKAKNFAYLTFTGPTFEADYTQVITEDGDLVWYSGRK